MKLSICIPSYNRAAYLKSFLEKLFLEIEHNSFQNTVEVIVSDNCSPDDTPAICSEFIGRGLIYTRNQENIGPDANFLKLFSLAQGEYIWLPGDDDTFCDGLITYILSTAEKEKFDYFYLRTMGEIAQPSSRSYSTVPNTELFGRTTIFTTFMTSQVIKAALIHPYIEEAKKYLGGYMAYYYIFAKALETAEICLISDQKEIHMTIENTGGYSFYKVWGDAVFASLYDTGFVKNKKLLSRFRLDMFLILILPVTYKQRQGGGGNKFSATSEKFDVTKYFAGFWYSAFFSLYRKAPIPLVGMVHLGVRIFNKVRRLSFGAVC